MPSRAFPQLDPNHVLPPRARTSGLQTGEIAWGSPRQFVAMIFHISCVWRAMVYST